MTTKLDTNNVSLAGEFAVLAQLALRGYVANMTLGRAKGIDILVANPDTGRMLKIEVKTSLKPLSWIMSEKHERLNDPDLFFCFVNITEDNDFRFFIVPSAVVADYLTRSHKHWADEKPSRKRASPMRIFLLCKPDETTPIPVPEMEHYANNWQFGGA
jgi:hypothetical protein